MANKPLPNITAKFFYNLCVMVFICGLPNFWIDDLFMSKSRMKIYRSFIRVVDLFVYIFLLFELAAFSTQKNLNEKQEVDLLMYSISHPILWCYCVILSNQTSKIKQVMSDILKLKQVFSDTEVEKQMVKKSKWYSSAFIFSILLAMVMYTFDALMRVVVDGVTFTTVVTAWPYVEDNSIPANLVRVFWNIIWWALVIRVIGVYAFVFSLTTSMSHQFIDLQKYFYSLDDIFNNETLERRQKEIKYEEAFKIGINLFVNTLRCVNQSKVVCGSIFNGQIIFNVVLLVIFMFQLMNSDRTLMSTGAIALSASGILIATGLFMCNAGDVTVEASSLATAMFFSGWQHCQGQRSINVRMLVTISMVFAQRPVVILGLGIVELSYQSYVSLVKSTYSVFSVIY